jgi:hypothetical protein
LALGAAGVSVVIRVVGRLGAGAGSTLTRIVVRVVAAAATRDLRVAPGSPSFVPAAAPASADGALSVIGETVIPGDGGGGGAAAGATAAAGCTAGAATGTGPRTRPDTNQIANPMITALPAITAFWIGNVRVTVGRGWLSQLSRESVGIGSFCSGTTVE